MRSGNPPSRDGGRAYDSSMATIDDIRNVLKTIDDPEMPISIVDLGLVEDIVIDDASRDGQHIDVTILPTFVGCPALDMIRDDIRTALRRLAGVAGVEVTFIHDPPWNVDRITDAGRERLRAHGVTVPARGRELRRPGGAAIAVRTSAIPCPFCNSSETELDSPFGPTRCRSIVYCRACRNSFEHMKRV